MWPMTRIISVVSSLAAGFSGKCKLDETDFPWQGDLFTYDDTDVDKAWNTCKNYKDCTMFAINHNDKKTHLKTLANTNKPEHNPDMTVYLMSDQDIQSVTSHYWWKKIECVDWPHTGDLYSWDSKHNLQDNIRECELTYGCNVMVCNDGSCHGKSMKDVGQSTRDCSLRAYVREDNPWEPTLNRNGSANHSTNAALDSMDRIEDVIHDVEELHSSISKPTLNRNGSANHSTNAALDSMDRMEDVIHDVVELHSAISKPTLNRNGSANHSADIVPDSTDVMENDMAELRSTIVV